MNNEKSIWLGLTGTDNLFNLDKGNIDFLGKFSHRLIRVLIGEGVDINLDPCEQNRQKESWERKWRDVGELWVESQIKNDFLDMTEL